MKEKKSSLWVDLRSAAFVGVIASPIAIIFFMPVAGVMELSGTPFNFSDHWVIFVWAGTAAGALIGTKISEYDKENKASEPAQHPKVSQNIPDNKLKLRAGKVLDYLLAGILYSVMGYALILWLWKLVQNSFG